MTAAQAQIENDLLVPATALALVELDRLQARHRGPRIEHLSSAIRAAVHDPAVVLRARSAAARTPTASLRDFLSSVVEQLSALTRADTATVQICDPVTGALRVVAHSGLPPHVVRKFGVLDDDRTVSGSAARSGRQVGVGDLHRDPRFAPIQPVADLTRYRAVLATPLFDFAGRLIGVANALWRDPVQLDRVVMQTVGLYADFAGEHLRRLVIAHAGREVEDGVDTDVDPLARAMLAALLTPSPDDATPLGQLMADAGAGHGDRRGAEAELADLLVDRLLRVQIGIDGLRSLLTDEHALARLGTINGDVEEMLDVIRRHVVQAAADNDGDGGTQDLRHYSG